MVAVTKKPLINPNLITLKCVLFTFFGGLGCIFPFLPAHMYAIGLHRDEGRRVQIVAPLVSLIGPLLACLLADRWIAVKKSTTYGNYIRILTVIFMLLAAVFYALLLLVPRVERIEQHQPLASFACSHEGAFVFQQKCTEKKLCHNWKEPQTGNLQLTNCSYTCQNPYGFEDFYQPWINQRPAALVNAPQAAPQEYSQELDYVEDEPDRQRRQISAQSEKPNPPPHVCVTTDKQVVCHAYVPETKFIKVKAMLTNNGQVENDTFSEEWCRYPIDNYRCEVPEAQSRIMQEVNPDCNPVVECNIHDPYESNSVLSNSLCIKIIGDVDVTVWSYFTIRLIADIFPLAVIVLLDTAILIATRETSTGRGDVGHQLAYGALGWAIFAPIVGILNPFEVQMYILPIAVGTVLIFISAVILLFSSRMPLTPPEWWWHTKIGMLAIPLSAIRKYSFEIVGIFIVSILLGGLWGAVDQYQWWHLFEISDSNYTADQVTGLSLLVAGLLAFPLFWFAEKIVDFCGHSNILIISFCLYIIRFLGLAIVRDSWLMLIFEAFESVTLGLTWVTLVLYMRYLVPRRLIATGQAIPVIGHFVLGRLAGALIGLRQDDNDLLASFQCTYRGLSVIAAILAIIYCVLYQFWLAPRCIPPTQAPPSETLIGPTTNGNGTYTPLRVYHDGRAKKGHFRY